jgi:hypothetical protein
MPPPPPIAESESFQIVLLGSFNPAIFHPLWFSRFELVGVDDTVNTDVKVVSPEFTDVGLGAIHLQCVPNRFTLETGNIAFQEKLRDLAEGLLALLPHTPIKGCGLNSAAHYRIADTEYWHHIGHVLAPKELIWDGLFPEVSNLPNPLNMPRSGLTNLGIQGRRDGLYPGFLNLSVAPSGAVKPGLFFASNHHYDVPEEFTQVGSAAHVRAFIHETWKKAFENAKLVGRTVFDKIKHP